MHSMHPIADVGECRSLRAHTAAASGTSPPQITTQKRSSAHPPTACCAAATSAKVVYEEMDWGSQWDVAAYVQRNPDIPASCNHGAQSDLPGGSRPRVVVGPGTAIAGCLHALRTLGCSDSPARGRTAGPIGGRELMHPLS
jgi:hypothetical protein